MIEKMHFRISSALKDVIGKDLITDDFVAIFELVKNSFDAYASNVVIEFIFDNDILQKILICDDGKGMSKIDLIKKWLFVGYSAKRDGSEDKEKRIYTGYKGIGRFSCDRLGRKLLLEANTNDGNKINCLAIDWDSFELDSMDEFVDIDVIFEEKDNYTINCGKITDNKGVRLEIGRIRNEQFWTRDRLIRLRRSLEKLIDPINNENNIYIKCDSQLDADKRSQKLSEKKGTTLTRVNGKIENTIFEVLEDKTTKLKGKITDLGKLQVSLIDRSILIYRTEEPIAEDFPELINSNFEIELSFVNRSAKILFHRRMGQPVVSYGSLFLLRNGFRVYPVGEEGNDYWGFEHRKQQGFARYLSSRDLLGFVKIYGSEDKFRESSSRDQGLIKTKASLELIELVKKCMIKLEAYVVGISWKDKLDKFNSDFERMKLDNNRYLIIELIEKLSNSKNITLLEYNKEIVSLLSEKIDEFEPSIAKLQTIANNSKDEKLLKQVERAKDKLIKLQVEKERAQQLAEHERSARKKTEQYLDQVSEEKEKIKQDLTEEQKRNLFLTQSKDRDKDLLQNFMHQIVLYSSAVKSKIQTAIEFPDDHSKEELLNKITDIFELNEKIISTSRFAVNANFRLKSSKIEEDLNLFLEEYLKTISKIINRKYVEIKYDITNKSFVLNFNPIELGMALENLVSNSSKARAHTVLFRSEVKNEILYLFIEDDGDGLSDNIREPRRIFEKGFTRTSGSGLGLYFCKNIINSMGGDIMVSEKQPDKGFSITIKVAKK